MTRGLPSRVWSWAWLTQACGRWWCHAQHRKYWKHLATSANATAGVCRVCGRSWTLARASRGEQDARRL
jgi:hypothetical protein